MISSLTSLCVVKIMLKCWFFVIFLAPKRNNKTPKSEPEPETEPESGKLENHYDFSEMFDFSFDNAVRLFTFRTGG